MVKLGTDDGKPGWFLKSSNTRTLEPNIHTEEVHVLDYIKNTTAIEKNTKFKRKN